MLYLEWEREYSIIPTCEVLIAKSFFNHFVSLLVVYLIFPVSNYMRQNWPT